MKPYSVTFDRGVGGTKRVRATSARAAFIAAFLNRHGGCDFAYESAYVHDDARDDCEMFYGVTTGVGKMKVVES